MEAGVSIHIRLVVILVVALTGCAPRSGKQLDEACDDDKECASELNWVPELRDHKVCLKPCGPAAIEPPDPNADTSCPSGWECNALLTSVVTDRNGKKLRGFGGFADRPYCVPRGWRSKTLPSDVPPAYVPLPPRD
jgi:hypothetical protein